TRVQKWPTCHFRVRATAARCALRWSRRAFWSNMKLGQHSNSRVDGDRAVRPRCSSAYNGRSRLSGRRRVAGAMGRAGVGRAAGGGRRVVQAGCPGYLGRHAALRGICASYARDRKANRGGVARSGYPALLAVTFAFGGDLSTVVRLQQAAWAVLILALAATAQTATRNAAGLVPIILVAMYPGLLLFRHVLTADLLFAVFLNLAMAGLLVATCVGRTARCSAVAAAVLCAALAACLRSQGMLVPIAAVLVGACVARPDTPTRLAVIALSVAAALALLAAGSRFGASDSDRASIVFLPKTLFCNHLNIVLASDAARREIVSAARGPADGAMALA